MNRAAKGRANEHRSMRFLTEQGYYPIRSAGSHGAIDVIGFYVGDNPTTQPLLIGVQSKTNSGYSESSLITLRMIIRMLKKNVTEVLNTNISQSTLFNLINPVIELHNWEKYQHRPERTILGETRQEDITIY